MSNETVNRWIGGSPFAVLARLVLASILVGVVMAAIGLDPLHIVESVRNLIRNGFQAGFEIMRWLWQYFILGAVIVIPLWIVLRLISTARRR